MKRKDQLKYLDQMKSLFSPPFVSKHQEIVWAAINEFGVKEVPGAGNNEQILKYHESSIAGFKQDAIPWCSSFVNWCCDQAKVEKTGSAMARSWLKWGQQIEHPRVGDLVILRRTTDPKLGHVGFLAKTPKWYDINLIVLGGNQNDEVNISAFPRILALSYRRL